uniref:Ovule protein n=1 Tax=Caenorhabditis tropicalis TaxID=1561998 RepID=A0A1I7TYF7_9PELO
MRIWSGFRKVSTIRKHPTIIHRPPVITESSQIFDPDLWQFSSEVSHFSPSNSISFSQESESAGETDGGNSGNSESTEAPEIETKKKNSNRSDAIPPKVIHNDNIVI